MSVFDLDAALAKGGSTSGDVFDLDAALAAQKQTDPPFTGVDDPRFLAARDRGEREGTARAAGPALAILGGGALGGLAGGAVAGAGKLLAHPAVAGTIGAVSGYQHGGIRGAIMEGLVGAAGGPILGRLGQALRAGKALQTAAPVGKAVAEAAPAVAAAAPVVAAKVVPATIAGEKIFAVMDAAGTPIQTFTNAAKALQFANETRRAGTAVKTAVEAAPAVASTVAKAIPTGKEVATRHAALVQFAKDAAARNPKVGEKIWIALDKAGNPVKLLTPDQAGAAKRAGIDTTWVRNLWK